MTEKIKLKVIDLFGRIVEQQDGLSTNITLTIGGNYRPGLYFVKVTLGNEAKTITVIKLP